ncbi:hypothetical protein N0V93_005804 [Gnomoniopsis smithogilvyi]|uniref:Pentatricopeptide repeat-containing protein n=1 Tax=Gnomoniopsis smithogilvyi TaxID=1191159 RepID=A0A9W9CYD8_9PEZI|nr:hypothetical protein N0V93_005804 [Gnomoniopsis smithogilvyi]
MQSSQMICFSCRRQLVTAALSKARLPRVPQWHTRTSFRSTSSTTQNPKPYSVEDFVSSSLDQPQANTDIDFDIDTDTDIDISEPWATGDDIPNAKDAGANHGPRSPGRFSITSQRGRLGKTVGRSRKTSLKIFENVVRQQGSRDGKAATPAELRDLSPEGAEYYNNLARLRPMMKEQSIEDCLEFFLAKLWNKSPFEGRNRLLQQRGAYLMGKVAVAKTANHDNQRLPSVSQITQYFHEMDSLGSSKWSNMMFGLIRAILAKSAARTDYESDEAYAAAKLQKERLIDDLVDSWIIFHRHRMCPDHSTLQTSEEAEFRLPDIDPHQLRFYAWKQNYKGALSCIFPEWMGQIREIPAVAIATFVMLVDDDQSTASARQKAKPLLVPIGHVFSACPIRPPAISEMLKSHPTVLLYVLNQWDVVMKRLHGSRGSNQKQKLREGVDGLEKSDQQEEHRRHASASDGRTVWRVSSYEKHILAKIKYAIGMSDVLTLEALWRDFWGSSKVRKISDDIKNYTKIFDNFIMAFTALQKPNSAIDVWDAMISIGLSPTLGTWSSMIEGCRKGRNGAGIENVWRKLVASGIPLDETVWSSRIVGLMEAGEPEAGIRALHEMLRMSQLAGGVPLNIKAVNAAVTGLLRLNAKSAANDVLLWASQHGIEPDVYTYNILLGPLVAEGRSAEIKSTLKLMSDSNIKPNAATYTILLEGLIGTIHNLPSVQQRLSVEKLLADMEQDGVVANLENFGRMLHLVLRDVRYTDNHTEGAVGAIFKHMERKGMAPSPHILTMLVDHYATRTPPALTDIDLLLQTYSHSLVDRVFWEHVIKAYALAGATDRAFAWFEKTYFTSSIITLDTLEILLRALVKDDKMAAAARVVDNVKQHRGASIGGMNNSAKFLAQRTRWDRYWRHGFWGHAMDCGLLGEAEWRRMAEPEELARFGTSPSPTAGGS